MKFATLILILTTVAITSTGQTGSSSEPKLVNAPTAKRSAEARKTRIGGTVSVLVHIDENGKVRSATDATGPDWVCPGLNRPDVLALREEAIKAALTARFEPKILDGKAVPTTAYLTFSFPRDKKRIGVSAIGHQSPANVSNKDANSTPTPAYPLAARAAKASGPVIIQVLIEVDGSVFSAEPTSGHPLLLSAARSAACNAKFSPTILSGQPVRVTGSVTYNFVLDNNSDNP